MHLPHFFLKKLLSSNSDAYAGVKFLVLLRKYKAMRFYFGVILSFLILGCTSNTKEVERLNNEGVAFLDVENYEKAELALQKAWALKDVSEELKSAVARNLSLLHSAKNQTDSAAYYAKKSFEIAPKDSYYYCVSKAEFELIQKNIDAARDWYEKAKAINPDDMAVYNSLGMIYSGKYGFKYENVEKALINNQKAYELSPRDPLAESLAFSYMNVDKYTESLTLWKKLRKSQINL